MAHIKSLDKLSDLILVNRIKRYYKRDEALKELCIRHSNLYFDILHRTLGNDFLEKADLQSDSVYFIFQAAKDFDISRKIKFSSYLGLKIRWHCLNLNKKCAKYLNNNLDNINENIIIDYSPNNFLNKIDQNYVKQFFRYLKNNEEKRVYKIFQLRYLRSKKKPMIWAKVAEEIALTEQSCINIHNRTIKKFLNKINKIEKIRNVI